MEHVVWSSLAAIGSEGAFTNCEHLPQRGVGEATISSSVNKMKLNVDQAKRLSHYCEESKTYPTYKTLDNKQEETNLEDVE